MEEFSRKSVPQCNSTTHIFYQYVTDDIDLKKNHKKKKTSSVNERIEILCEK